MPSSSAPAPTPPASSMSEFGLEPVVGPAGGAARAPSLFSLIIGFPTLRLRGPYFALAMLSGAAMMQSLTLIFCAAIPAARKAPRPRSHLRLSLADITLPRAAFAGARGTAEASWRNSSWGTILRAIRGDEAACQAAGINVTFYKIASLMISAAFAGTRRRALRPLPAAVDPISSPWCSRSPSSSWSMSAAWARSTDRSAAHRAGDLLTGAAARLQRVSSLGLHVILMFILFFMPQGLGRTLVAARSRAARHDARCSKSSGLTSASAASTRCKDVSFALQTGSSHRHARPQRRRQDDALQPAHRLHRRSIRARVNFDGAVAARPRAPSHRQSRPCPHLPARPALPRHDRAGERGGRLPRAAGPP